MNDKLAYRRDGVRVQTSQGWFVDVTGGQHSLLFCRPRKRGLSTSILDDLDLVGVNRYFTNENVLALRQWIADFDETPKLRSYFVSGGTEAFEASIAIAEHVTAEVYGRAPGAVIGLSESYHGFSIAALNAGDHPVHKNRVLGSNNLNWPKLERSAMRTPAQISCVLGDLIERINVTSVVIEPIGGTTSGALTLDPTVLEAVRETCRRNGIVFIADEVITGFGRTGAPFCLRRDEYDIRISGKLLGGGIVPICAVMLSPHFQKICEGCAFEPPLRFTYSGNALATKVALNLQKLRDVGEPLDVTNKGIYLRSMLEVQLAGLNTSIRGRGLLQAVSFHCDDPLKGLQSLVSKAWSMGVLLMGGISAAEKSVHIMVTPPLDASYDDLGVMVKAIEQVLKTAAYDNEPPLVFAN